MAGLAVAVLALVAPVTSAWSAPARTPAIKTTRTTTPPPPPPPPGAWIVVDADTGNLIEANNAHVPMRPASLTKVITAITAAALIPPDATVPVSPRAAAMPAHNLNMKAGQVWSYTDAMHALLLSSANDAAVALAERAGGTVETFQQQFAATATALGMQDAPVLQDPAGLDDAESVGGGNLVSARDLAIAARALLATPDLADAVSQREYRFDGVDGVAHRLINHNRLLRLYAGAIGMKTGYTKRAGQCLIAAARRDGRTIITVVLKANGSTYDPSMALLDKGFATPLAAESSADRLPAVPRNLTSALRRSLTLSTTVDQPVVAPGESAAGALPSPAPAKDGPDTLGTVVNVVSTGPLMAVEIGAGTVGLLRIRARRRQRRRRAHAKKRH